MSTHFSEGVAEEDCSSLRSKKNVQLSVLLTYMAVWVFYTFSCTKLRMNPPVTLGFKFQLLPRKWGGGV